MYKQKEGSYSTTISAYSTDRDFINRQCDEIGISQKRVVALLVQAYKEYGQKDTNSPYKELAEKVQETLDKLLKRDDRVIAFIKEQERVLLKPILENTQITDAQLKQLVSILANLE
ncbi:MAG: hypothetical protein IJP81_04735 [Bacteroidales bacterium]|nr:hypothetical protein [Bacteroidales bacterium]